MKNLHFLTQPPLNKNCHNPSPSQKSSAVQVEIPSQRCKVKVKVYSLKDFDLFLLLVLNLQFKSLQSPPTLWRTLVWEIFPAQPRSRDTTLSPRVTRRGWGRMGSEEDISEDEEDSGTTTITPPSQVSSWLIILGKITCTQRHTGSQQIDFVLSEKTFSEIIPDQNHAALWHWSLTRNPHHPHHSALQQSTTFLGNFL